MLRGDFSAQLQKEDRFHIYRDVITMVVKSMCNQADEVFNDTKSSTVLDYYYDFKGNHCKGFSEDMRGKHNERETFIEKHDLTEKFKLFLGVLKHITVEKAHEWLQGEVSKQAELARAGDENAVIVVPSVSRSTAYRSMREAGAVYREAKKSYYTDRHESPENIANRGNRGNRRGWKCCNYGK